MNVWLRKPGDDMDIMGVSESRLASPPVPFQVSINQTSGKPWLAVPPCSTQAEVAKGPSEHVSKYGFCQGEPLRSR